MLRTPCLSLFIQPRHGPVLLRDRLVALGDTLTCTNRCYCKRAWVCSILRASTGTDTATTMYSSRQCFQSSAHFRSLNATWNSILRMPRLTKSHRVCTCTRQRISLHRATAPASRRGKSLYEYTYKYLPAALRLQVSEPRRSTAALDWGPVSAHVSHDSAICHDEANVALPFDIHIA